MTASLPPSYFDAKYAADPDPWRFATSEYEREKYAATLAALAGRHFASALEVGCSIGVLTRALAPQCQHLLALDVAPAALDQARARCADLAQVRFERLQVPGEWPDGQYGLILLSEVVYYLSAADVDALAARMRGSLAPGAMVLLVHWLGPTDYPLSGDEAAERLIGALGFAPVLQRREPQYRLDLLEGDSFWQPKLSRSSNLFWRACLSRLKVNLWRSCSGGSLSAQSPGVKT